MFYIYMQMLGFCECLCNSYLLYLFIYLFIYLI